MRLQKEIPLHWSGISFFYQCWMLEQFQLLPWVVRLMRFGAVKQLNVAKLLIGYTQNTYLTIIGNSVFNSLDMHFCILHTSAMPKIDGKLKHGEPIAQQKVTKIYVSFLVFLGFCW